MQNVVLKKHDAGASGQGFGEGYVSGLRSVPHRSLVETPKGGYWAGDPLRAYALHCLRSTVGPVLSSFPMEWAYRSILSAVRYGSHGDDTGLNPVYSQTQGDKTWY